MTGLVESHGGLLGETLAQSCPRISDRGKTTSQDGAGHVHAGQERNSDRCGVTPEQTLFGRSLRWFCTAEAALTALLEQDLQEQLRASQHRRSQVVKGMLFSGTKVLPHPCKGRQRSDTERSYTAGRCGKVVICFVRGSSGRRGGEKESCFG